MQFSIKLDKVLDTKWRKLSQDKQLPLINRMINFKRYKSDLKLYKVREYWATPQEFLKYGGDCEDYCFAKYFILIELGFNKSDFRFFHVVTKRGIHHMVLGFKTDKGFIIMDNNTSKIDLLEVRTDLTLVYSFDDTYIYEKDKKRKNNKKKWVNLLERMDDE